MCKQELEYLYEYSPDNKDELLELVFGIEPKVSLPNQLELEVEEEDLLEMFHNFSDYIPLEETETEYEVLPEASEFLSFSLSDRVALVSEGIAEYCKRYSLGAVLDNITATDALVIAQTVKMLGTQGSTKVLNDYQIHVKYSESRSPEIVVNVLKEFGAIVVPLDSEYVSRVTYLLDSAHIKYYCVKSEKSVTIFLEK
jgi:hypothetical protein